MYKALTSLHPFVPCTRYTKILAFFYRHQTLCIYNYCALNIAEKLLTGFILFWISKFPWLFHDFPGAFLLFSMTKHTSMTWTWCWLDFRRARDICHYWPLLGNSPMCEVRTSSKCTIFALDLLAARTSDGKMKIKNGVVLFFGPDLLNFPDFVSNSLTISGIPWQSMTWKSHSRIPWLPWPSLTRTSPVHIIVHYFHMS